MNKLIALLLILTVIVSVAACTDVRATTDISETTVTDTSISPPGQEPAPLQWIALGDSITEGLYSYLQEDSTQTRALDTENCWAATAAKINGWKLTNYGVSGSGYVYPGLDGLNARQRVDTIDFSGADLVTLSFGVNDWKHNSVLGNISDDPAAGGSLCSNMKYCINKIRTDNPNARIVVLSPLICSRWGTAWTEWSVNVAFSNSGSLQDVFRAEQEICALYGVEFIDLLRGCETVTMENAGASLPDGLHPSVAVHAQLGTEIAEKLKTQYTGGNKNGCH